MNKSNLLFTLLGFLALILLSCQNKKSNALATLKFKSIDKVKRPNLIFYLSDDQDVYDYGCYGNNKVKTPAVDVLAKEGLLFENAFTGQAICAPSRSQLLTGKYPIKNGCFANHTNTKPSIESITKHMRSLGYEVIRAGKSHIKPKSVYDWDRAWEAVEKNTGPRPYIPLDSIESYFKSSKKPFFMLIASYYPHSKYFTVENPKSEDIEIFPFNADKKDDQSFIKNRAGYYRSIEEDNKDLDAVLKLVDTHLDSKNTLFIYSADHGLSGKFTVKDVGLKVPFIARWPNVIKPGIRSKQLIHYSDVLPTFMEIAGGKATSDMDGKSFLPLLKGEDIEINDYVYGVRVNQNILQSEIFPSRMIRDKRYKYIRNFNALEVLNQNLGNKPNVNVFIKRGAMAFKDEPFEELYDLEKDPFEQNNLAKNLEFKEIKERLIKDMFVWMVAQGDYLNDNIGYMPIITPKGNRGFKLDKDTPKRKIADSLKNTLKEGDYLVIEHW
jgi:uncharacterized sulfatase